jgi:hypothetical protein
MFDYGVTQAFDDLVALEGQIRALHTKYGGIIPVFGYDPVEAETEEGQKALEQRVEQINEMLGGESVMGIPLGGYEQSLKDGFQFISLNDLKIDMHNTLVKRLEDKLETFLMGARFSSTDAGSFAKDNVQAEQKDKMMLHLTKVMVNEMQKLIVLDSQLYGYEHWNFSFKFREILTEEEVINLEMKKAESQMFRGQSAIQLVQAVGVMKGQGIDEMLISRVLNVPPEFVAPIQATEVSVVEGDNKNSNADVKGSGGDTSSSGETT